MCRPLEIIVDFFLTLTVSYAHCHYVPLRVFFCCWKSSRARKTNSFTITSFTWSVLFFISIILSTNQSEKSLRYFKMCFVSGFPFTIVGVTLIVTGIEKYVAEHCWLTLEHNILYCAFVAPAAMIVLVSILS